MLDRIGRIDGSAESRNPECFHDRRPFCVTGHCKLNEVTERRYRVDRLLNRTETALAVQVQASIPILALPEGSVIDRALTYHPAPYRRRPGLKG